VQWRLVGSVLCTYGCAISCCTPLDIAIQTCNRDVGCLPIKKYHTYFVDQMGQVSGEDDMKAEIYARGPIVGVYMCQCWCGESSDGVV
jgi:hypothetical protein